MSSPTSPSINCLYCNRPADQATGPEPDRRKAGICPECRGPHHVWCWHMHGGCSRPNCVCNPKTPGHGPIPFQPSQVRDLDPLPGTPERARKQPDRWAAFEKFESEYATGSHRRIAMAWDDSLFNHFQPAEKYRAEVETARKCVRSLELLVTEYRRKHWQGVLDIYRTQSDHFDSCLDFQTNFKSHVEQARRELADDFKQRLETALARNDDEELEKILAESNLGYRPSAMLQVLEQMQVVNADQRALAAVALERLAVIRQIQNYLSRLDTQDRALALYDDKQAEFHLADSRALTKADRSALYEVRRAHARDSLRQAVIHGDDKELLTAAAAALAAGWTLPDSTLELVRQAGERQAARDRVSNAKSETELLVAYDDELLRNDKDIDPATHDTVENTRRSYKALLAVRRAIKRNDLRTVAALITDPEQAQELAALLDDSERDVLLRVHYSVQNLNELRAVLAAQPLTQASLLQVTELCGNLETRHNLTLLMSPYENQQVNRALLAANVVDELTRLDNAPDNALIKLAIAKAYRKHRMQASVCPVR